MTRIGIITQARTTSTRLPNKVLLSAGNRTMLDHHLDRLAATGYPVIVATTVNPSDDRIVDVAHSHGAHVFRGSEHDVLSRFAGAAAAKSLDAVVRVTSDCPLIDADLIRVGVERFLNIDDTHAYVSNVIERTFPRGFDFEVFSASSLYEANRLAVLDMDREHVTPYLNQNRAGHTVYAHVARTVDASPYRVTLDTADDLTLLKALIEDFNAAHLSADEIIAVLDAHPDLVSINAHIEQKKLGE